MGMDHNMLAAQLGPEEAMKAKVMAAAVEEEVLAVEVVVMVEVVAVIAAAAMDRKSRPLEFSPSHMEGEAR